MALPKYEGGTSYVRALDDHVVGEAEAVKYAMDRFGEEFKAWFNNTFIPSLLDTAAGNSGADNIGVTPILEGADTVQKTLAALLTQVQSSALGQIPDGTITDAKLSNTTGQIKDKVSDLQDEVTAISNEVTSHLADYMPHDDELNQYASEADENGIYTVVEFKRPSSGTLYMKSTLSNPDENWNYQTVTWNFYNETGSQVVLTLVWTITYDEEGGIISKVVAA